MSYEGSVRECNGGTVPIYPTYPVSNYPVSYDADSNAQSLFYNLHQEGEVIQTAGQTYNNKVKNYSDQLAAMPKITEEKPLVVEPPRQSESTSFVSRSLSLAGRVASHIKDYFLGDGFRLLGAMAAVLTTAAIMRKYPNRFAIPTLEGNWGGKYGHQHHW